MAARREANPRKQPDAAVMVEMAGLTTHVLDTAHGRPAEGLAIRLYEIADDGKPHRLLAETRTNSDGRCDGPLLSREALIPGCYRLEFDAGEYFKSLGLDLPVPAFLNTVVIDFGLAEAGGHYHVPLLLSPYGYTTYRGS